MCRDLEAAHSKSRGKGPEVCVALPCSRSSEDAVWLGRAKWSRGSKLRSEATGAACTGSWQSLKSKRVVVLR